ncbi:uncharacterized protein ASCRUDRAFT_76905 [Ascoidea rubescens DSM 1968]|uniref:Uncharacterized protein n=1 Tax=Ascoidea rubescens DSM 1968 TaxID=1344418 RepID=A0A1D2VEI4_9ASCO|nr:hypothetical protein ASCRUDRAFT_76905 [Ascoidea rubescens DSM 1968]ODV59992.1 hypothetical protein ASCRUDRAFT_76905 [Ascoidea rubescens DSM 1968]
MGIVKLQVIMLKHHMRRKWFIKRKLTSRSYQNPKLYQKRHQKTPQMNLQKKMTRKQIIQELLALLRGSQSTKTEKVPGNTQSNNSSNTSNRLENLSKPIQAKNVYGEIMAEVNKGALYPNPGFIPIPHPGQMLPPGAQMLPMMVPGYQNNIFIPSNYGMVMAPVYEPAQVLPTNDEATNEVKSLLRGLGGLKINSPDENQQQETQNISQESVFNPSNTGPNNATVNINNNNNQFLQHDGYVPNEPRGQRSSNYNQRGRGGRNNRNGRGNFRNNDRNNRNSNSNGSGFSPNQKKYNNRHYYGGSYNRTANDERTSDD